MKLFYKKDYFNVLQDYENAMKLYEYTYNNYLDTLQEKNHQEEMYQELAYDLIKTKNKIREINGEKGGLTKENNKLKKEIDTLKSNIQELEDKLKESMTDKYLVKQVRPGRTANTQKTKISRPMSENVRRFMKDNFE